MTLINAHRGNPISFRENTMPAFASAVNLGADCIELDIWASQDKRAVVLHDETLERLWGIQEHVSHLPYGRIRELTQNSEVYVPALEEVLSSFAIPVMVDFVSDTAVEPIIHVLSEERATDRCIISSGNVPALLAIRERLKDVSIALTWNDIIPPSNQLMRMLDVQYFNPNYHLYQDGFIAEMSSQNIESSPHAGLMRVALEKRQKHPDWYQPDMRCGSHMVQTMHTSGLKTSAWTVDEPAVMLELINLGLDLMTTNDVRTLLEVRNGR